MGKNLIRQIVLATIFTILLVGSASAVTVINNCNFNADMDGENYVLGNNLNCGVGVPSIIIGAHNVSIDGYNETDGVAYWINGSIGAVADCSKWGVFDEMSPNIDDCGIVNTGGWDNVVIKNCEIKNFCTGIAIGTRGWGVYEENVTVTNCMIHDCGRSSESPTHGIHMVGPNYCNITKNEIYNIQGSGTGCGAGGNGVFLRGDRDQGEGPPLSGDYNTITGNKISDNRKSGIFSKYMCMYSTVSYNIATGNGEGGITLMCKHSSYNAIKDNNASGNIESGIFIGGYNNILRNNTANNNGYAGIAMGRSDGSYNNELYENTVCGNSEYDIRTCGPECYGNHGDNNTCDTASNYCDDSAGCPPPCVYQCAGEGADLEITNIEFATWIVEGVNYTMNYTVTNTGVDPAGASDTGVYINGDWVQNDSVPALTASASYSSTLGPFSVTGANGLDTVKACADGNHEVMESNEDNNCHEDTFCGPDLLITDFHEEWIDSGTWKRYNLSYTVKNIGDIATTDDCWTNFTELNGEWSDCINPVPISAGLAVGATEAHIVGPFVMEGGGDWLQAWVNFNYTCPVNEWDELHHDRARFTADYEGSGGCCDECGDVDCNTFVNVGDALAIYNNVPTPEQLCCQWAADADCNTFVNVGDALTVYNNVPTPELLNCCTGGCAY